MTRVVVTGMAGISPIGNDWQTISGNLKNMKTGVRFMPEWEKYDGLNTRLAAPAEFEKPAHFTRKATRSMGRVSLMATIAAEQALEEAGLLGNDIIKDGRMGVSVGSSSGSTDAIAEFGKMLLEDSTRGMNATSYVRMMAHTAPVNIGVYFGLKGRVITTSSACTSGSQGLGFAYEAIKSGKQSMMLAGGCESLCPTQAAVFDTLFATSTLNDEPEKTPRPFDKDRDGLVIGEGACIFVLESLESAEERGATILAELVGFGTNSDGAHVTQPQSETMRIAMELALEDAELDGEKIGYVSAHGTATDRGDVAETTATSGLLGANTPISSLKGFTGHTLGACGSLEAMVTIRSMNEGWFHANANLDNVDPDCGELDYIRGEVRKIDTNYVMNNNFAFGGINTSLIFKRWQ